MGLSQPSSAIREGAYIGTGSVIVKDVPDGAVVAGVPAQPLPAGARRE